MSKWLRNSYLFLVYSFLYLPLLVLMIGSFTSDSHLTFKWYQQLIADPNISTVTINSLILAITSSTIATFLGIILSTVLYRYRFIGRKLLNGSLLIYIVIPDIVVGVSLLLLMNLLRIQFGFISMLIGHIVLCLPFVVLMINSRLHDFNPQLFQAAKDLGATEYTLFKKIIIPLLLPALISAWLISFTLSMDDVIISFFLSGPSFQVLPLYIFSLARFGVSPELNAICTIIFVFTLTMIILGKKWLKHI